MGECSFWYRPTRVVPDQRPLNGRCCCCCIVMILTLCCKPANSRKTPMEDIIRQCSADQNTGVILRIIMINATMLGPSLFFCFLPIPFSPFASPFLFHLSPLFTCHLLSFFFTLHFSAFSSPSSLPWKGRRGVACLCLCSGEW